MIQKISSFTFLFICLITCIAIADEIPVYKHDNPPTTPSLEDLPLQNSITQHGITWTFSEPVRVGRFVNGDYYVIGSPVRIIDIDPLPTQENGRHGSVLHMPSSNQQSGFDDRTQGGRYTPSLRVYPPFTMQPGNSLISSISAGSVGENNVVLQDQSSISPVRSVSVLTCLDTPVPADAFRPTYADTTKIIYYSHNLNRNLLLSLDSSGIDFDVAYVSNFNLDYFTEIFQRAWIDTLQYNFDVPSDYTPHYARENGRAVGIASLLLNLDYTPEEKEELLVYFVQYGIDLHGAVRSGIYGWPAHGGHGSGRKWPIIFAGLMLNEDTMKYVNTYFPNTRFGEDMHTYSAVYDDPVWDTNWGTSWTGADVVYSGHKGVWQGEIVSGEPDEGPYEHLQPEDWLDDGCESYRRCCTSIAWVGQALAARLMNAEDEWDHYAFFDYVDRWMTEDDTQHLQTILDQTGWNYFGAPRQRETWDGFVDSMWAEYRNYSDNNNIPPSPPKGLRILENP